MKADLEPPDSKSGKLPPGRPPKVTSQIDTFDALSRDARLARLKQAARHTDLRPETLLYCVCAAHGVEDKELYWAAFEALIKAATPMIAGRMRRAHAWRKNCRKACCSRTPASPSSNPSTSGQAGVIEPQISES